MPPGIPLCISAADTERRQFRRIEPDQLSRSKFTWLEYLSHEKRVNANLELPALQSKFSMTLRIARTRQSSRTDGMIYSTAGVIPHFFPHHFWNPVFILKHEDVLLNEKPNAKVVDTTTSFISLNSPQTSERRSVWFCWLDSCLCSFAQNCCLTCTGTCTATL